MIALPMGPMPLISSGAEMLMLLADTSLCETLGNALTKKGLGKDLEPWLLRLRRRLNRFSSRPYLARRFSKQIGWQFGMMIHRYVQLGTADTPDVLRELGAIPLVTDVRRWGHPLEAGSNLRFFAIQFLLLGAGMWQLETCGSRRQQTQVTSRWNWLLMVLRFGNRSALSMEMMWLYRALWGVADPDIGRMD